MPVLTDEDVGLSTPVLSDADVGIGVLNDADVGLDAPKPKSKKYLAMQKEQAALREKDEGGTVAKVLTVAENIVRPFPNPVGAALKIPEQLAAAVGQPTPYTATALLVSPEAAMKVVEAVTPGGKATSGTVARGVQEFVAEMASGLTSPDMAGLMLAGTKAPVPVGRYFQGEMLSHLPESVQAAAAAEGAQESTKATLAAASNVLFPALIQKGIAKAEAPKPAVVTTTIIERAKEVGPATEAALSGKESKPTASTPEPATVPPTTTTGETVKPATAESPAAAEPSLPISTIQKGIKQSVFQRVEERPHDLIDSLEGHLGGKLSLKKARKLIENFQPTGALRKLFASDGYAPDVAAQATGFKGSDVEFLEALQSAADARKGHRVTKRKESAQLELEAKQAEQAVPKLRQMEKQGDLLSTQDEPFALSGQKSLYLAAESKIKGSEEATGQLVGMGGAVPAEFELSQKTPTGIKNATVDQERIKRGLPAAMQPARRSFGAVWDSAMAKIDQDPAYTDRLVSELRDNPRALTDIEDATLLHRQIELQNEYGKATRDLAQAFDDARWEDVDAQKVRVVELSDRLLDLYNVEKAAGTETGRGLAARKMMAHEDFSLAKMEVEKRAAKSGEPLTDNERAQVVELNQKIEATQKAYDEYVSRTESRIAALEVERALAQVERQSRAEPQLDPRARSLADRIVQSLEKQADDSRAYLRGKLFTISPDVLFHLSRIGAAAIARGALDFSRWSGAMLGEFGERIQPYLQEVFDASNKLLDKSVESVAGKQRAPRAKRAVTGADAAEQQRTLTDGIKEKIKANELDAITPLVQKLARLFVEQGVKERDPLIDAVHGVLNEIDPEITRRDAMDAISGYGKYKQLTKDEISVQLRDLKGQMQQVGKLEDMQAGKPPSKTGLERRIPTTEERRLIKLVNEAKNKFQIPITDEATQLKSSLDTLKTRLKNRITELEGRLTRKDFSTAPKRIIQLDPEAQRLHYEAAKVKTRWHEALMKDRLARRSVPAKILGAIGEVLNTSRAILTSLDLSAVLRQGGFITLGHPIKALKAFPAMFKALRSEAGQHAVNQEILSRKNYPLYQQSKLYLAEHGHKLSQMEEAYMSRWADKIPLVAASQRAYVTFLNRLRADSFDALTNSLAREKELTPTEAKAIANYVNVATGRGNIGMKENAAVGLSTVFFAPRYVASRFQLLAGQPLYRGSARTRKAIAKEYGRFLIGAAVVYGLAQLADGEIETDPRSSDFGKIRFGNTRIDPMAGLLQVSVLLARLGTGETKRLSGKVVPIRGEKVPYGSDDAADVTARFLRTKLSPVVGATVNVLAGSDVTGKPVTPASTSENLLVPLALQDILKTMEEQGVPKGTAMAILSIFGMGLQTYDN